MDDDNGGWTVAAILLMMALAAWFMFHVIDEAFEAERVRNEHNRQVCEGKGGVYLDRTYQSGRMTNHTYTCVKKDTIIEMGETNGTR